MVTREDSGHFAVQATSSTASELPETDTQLKSGRKNERQMSYKSLSVAGWPNSSAHKNQCTVKLCRRHHPLLGLGHRLLLYTDDGSSPKWMATLNGGRRNK